jgi:hypothetical protein
MKRLAEEWRRIPPADRDYETMLSQTNVFGAGSELKRDEGALQELMTLLSEAEAKLDIRAAVRCIATCQATPLEEMKVSCEVEYSTFFAPGRFDRVLYIGSGAYPTIALYVLERQEQIVIDGVDIIPHATVLCSQVAQRLGLSARLRPSTRDALDLPRETIREYDAFFVSSAVRPKHQILARLVAHKRPGARIYAREDEAHPDFYELVRIEHPDLLKARQARAMWARNKGAPAILPRGCEV